MLLDHLAPSNRRPRFAKGNPAQASTAQKSSDKGIYAALASTLKSPIAPEVADRNPSEIGKGKRRERKKSAPSVWSEQWPLRGAEQDHQDRLRRPQRDLSMVKVDDMEAEARYSRTKILQARVKRGLQLSDQEQAQSAELVEKPTRTTVRDLSKIPVADMDSETRKSRRKGLRRKIDRGETLSNFEQAQWQGLAPKR